MKNQEKNGSNRQWARSGTKCLFISFFSLDSIVCIHTIRGTQYSHSGIAIVFLPTLRRILYSPAPQTYLSRDRKKKKTHTGYYKPTQFSLNRTHCWQRFPCNFREIPGRYESELSQLDDVHPPPFKTIRRPTPPLTIVSQDLAKKRGPLFPILIKAARSNLH